MKCHHIGLLLTVFAVLCGKTGARQMCLSCQYVNNPKKDGLECSTAPRNWTFGDTRMRCNYRCLIVAHFDKKSGDPLYMYRGCTSTDDVTEDGCYDDEVKEYCTYTCVDMNYCNEKTFTTAPSMDETSGHTFTLSDVALILACQLILSGMGTV